MTNNFVLITCEHGGNRIPRQYRTLFDGHESLLSTHRAYDTGALRMARDLSAALHAPLCASTVNRLLIDLNRSATHPRVYSEIIRTAPAAIRQELRQHYHARYRDTVQRWIEKAVVNGRRAVHVSCHSFTPELDGRRRDADIGLLYDPARSAEAALCREWRDAINARMQALKIRMNYPYAGKTDGLTTAMRRRFAPEQYLGIELEINQRHVFESAVHWRAVRNAIAGALCDWRSGSDATPSTAGAHDLGEQSAQPCNPFLHVRYELHGARS